MHREAGPRSAVPAALALLAACCGAAPAAAQDGASPQEVIVSAERVDAPLATTPVSAGVIDSAEIQRKGIRQLNDIVGVVAGVAVPNGYSNMPQAVGIRGVGVSQPAMAQAVGIYIDDVPLVRGYATALWDLPDIARIEVLRGPQGTLYGENSSAGAVKIVSLDPGAETAAWAEAGAGSFGARELRGYANAALGPALDASLAFSRRRNDGFGFNATRSERVNKLDATQARAKLRLAAGPDFEAVLAIDGLLDRSDTNTINYPLGVPGAAPRVTFTAVDAGAFERRAGGISLRLTEALAPGLRLRSITAWRDYRDDPTVADWGGLAQQRFTLSQTVQQKTFSQELQLQHQDARLSWTAGAILVRDTFDFDRDSTAVPLAAPAPAYNEALSHFVTSDWGVYGQGRFAFDEATSLTAGLRAWHTRQTGSNAYWKTDAAYVRTSRVYDAPDLATTKTGWLPRVELARRFADGPFVYASLAQGAKFGGYNRAAQSLTSARVATDPEHVTTWELGVKGRALDGRLDYRLAAFRNDYRDYLAALNGLTIDGVLVTDSVLVNAGKARTWGLDAELAARLGDRTDLTLTTELLRTRFDEFANPSGSAAADYVGNELPNAPRLSLGSSLRHWLPLARGDALRGEVSLQHVGSQFTEVSNNPALRAPTQTYVNLETAWLSPGRHWTVSLRVRNAFDRTYVLLPNRIAPLGIDAGYYDPPRTLLASVRYDL